MGVVVGGFLLRGCVFCWVFCFVVVFFVFFLFVFLFGGGGVVKLAFRL